MKPFVPIPGETPIDPSGLKDRGITTRGELNIAEAENIRKVYVKYLAAPPSKRLAPFDMSWLCGLHEEMYRDVWEWAGRTRTGNINLGVDWRQVEPQLLSLSRDLLAWETLPLVEQATNLHFHAVRIHPFPNGNGRWARTAANIWLFQHDSGVIRWPEEAVGKESPVRAQYIAALKAADGGDFEKLLRLHDEFMEPA